MLADFVAVASVAAVWGVQDSVKLRGGIGEYLQVVSDAISAVREAAPDQIPEFDFPQAEETKTAEGTIWAYEGFESVRLATGLSEKTAALTIGTDNAQALLRRTPLDLETPLPDKDRALQSAFHWNVAGCVDAVGEWVDFAILASGIGGADNEEGPSMQAQVKAGLDLARCIRGISAVSYVEGDALVTHGQMVVRDLPEKAVGQEK